jgi:hypothetical protein
MGFTSFRSEGSFLANNNPPNIQQIPPIVNVMGAPTELANVTVIKLTKSDIPLEFNDSFDFYNINYNKIYKKSFDIP